MNENREKILLPAGIILLGAIFFLALTSLRPEAEKKAFDKKIQLVEVFKPELKSANIEVHSSGTVGSISEVNLIPQVAGKIESLSGNMVVGATFKKGDVLFKIEDNDYVYRKKAALAEVARQKVTLQKEEYESSLAKEEWEEFGAESGEKASALTLRIPQLQMAKANLDAAKANFRLAELNLARTEICAPFDGQVKSRMSDLGQYVSPGMVIASIFSTEKAEIQASIPYSERKWIKKGAKVELFSNEKKWEAFVSEIGGNLDPQSRFITLTISKENPYMEKNPLLTGLFVNVKIYGNLVDNVYTIERHFIRTGDKIFLYKNGELIIKSVQVLYHGKKYSYIKMNLENDEFIIKTNLKYAVKNMKLRVK
jgi:RND family efflux transporter MFP subunit